jgi:hypothetical protein
MPTKVWVAGEEVLATQFNQYVQEQVIATFPNAAARTAAIPAPKDGMHTWLIDVERLEVFDGESWRPTSGAPHTNAIRRMFTDHLVITNPGAFTPLPAGAGGDRTALTITFTKYAPDTTIVLQGVALFSVSSGSATQRFEFGIRRDAGGGALDVVLGQQTLAASQQVTAPYRLPPLVGLNTIAGLAAGTYTFQPIFRAAGGVVMDFWPQDDFIAFSVTETY